MKRSALLYVAVAAAAATVLFWNLGVRYLWQDEAACAELTVRMLEHGKPLAYDGTNLITMDEFNAAEGRFLERRTGSAEAAVEYYRQKGDYKDDTTWIGQPWGQFVFTASSFLLVGEGTLQARLPFALASVGTVVLLFGFIRRRFESTTMALIAVALLLTNTYWILHVRQCRYYGSSSFFLVLTVLAYFRWQDGRKYGALLFGLAAWGYFHNDFGSFFPVVGVLAVDALVAARKQWLRPFLTFAALGLSVLPFVFFYELLDRKKEQPADWWPRVTVTTEYVNSLQLPLILLVVLALLVVLRRIEWGAGQKRVIGLVVAVLVGQFFFITYVSPWPFYRYVVGMTPLSCLVAAFVVVHAGRFLAARWGDHAARAAGVALGALVLLTPWPSSALGWGIRVPKMFQTILPDSGTWLRTELGVLATDLAATGPDPNRGIVEFLRSVVRPGDEIVINYEDVPLQFYLDNPIRGGIACFRVEDESVAPAFLVQRRSAAITHAEPYNRVGRDHDWFKVEVDAPDIPWGNNPDPWGHYTRHGTSKWGSIDVYVNREVRRRLRPEPAPEGE